MADVRHLSTSLRFTLTLGGADDESVTKSVSVAKIGAGAGADALGALAASLGGLFEYPVVSVKKYDTGVLESE